MPIPAKPQAPAYICPVLEWIDQRRAEELLEAMDDRQRDVNSVHVARFTSLFRMGGWNPDVTSPVEISRSGTVLNGQHRLIALCNAIRSGDLLGAWFPVRRGVPEDAIYRIDSGKERSTTYLAQTMGVAHSRLVLGLLGYMQAEEYGKLESYANNHLKTAIPPEEVAQKWKSDPILRMAIGKACSEPWRGMRKIAGHLSVAIFVRTLLSRGIQPIDDFALGVATGADLAAHDPRMVLRNACLGERLRRRQSYPGTNADRLAVVRCLFLAWNAWRARSTLRGIKLIWQAPMPAPR